jgi:hypothetical protein
MNCSDLWADPIFPFNEKLLFRHELQIIQVLFHFDYQEIFGGCQIDAIGDEKDTNIYSE